MKTVFNFITAACWFACGVACSIASVASADEGPAQSVRVQRLASLVDYIAADYPGAVKGGQVIAATEYAEQKSMVKEARETLAGLLPTPGHEAFAARLEEGISKLETDVAVRAADEQVAADSRAVHQLLIDHYGLVLSPVAAPDLERARGQFAAVCADCHGKTGHADTPRAAQLDPHPLNFFDEERMSRISPSLAFHALTFGVSNTAMASFAALPPSDRWSLAFYVVSLRHDAKLAERGAAAYRAAKVQLAPTASRLAELSDAQLDGLLAQIAPADRPAAVAWLRTQAAFTPDPGGMFAEARRLLAQVGAHAGDKQQAREAAIAAYLEGIEPHEAALKAQDRELALRIEQAFLDLRQLIDSGAPPDAIRSEVARTTLILDGAEERGAAGASVPFFAAFAIALREGFELSLLVAALLAFLRKSGHGEQARFVHFGWAAAVPAGLVTWFALGAVLGGARRELTEGILTLLAAGMLLFVSHFVLGRLESRKWLKFLERKTTSAAETARRVPLMLMGVSFVAAYREGIEIVLFFRALVLDSPGAGLWIAVGAAAGVAVLVGLIQVMNTLGKRLDPRPLMLVSSVLLTAIAISLVGQGVRALQEGGYVHLWPLERMPTVPVLGLYPSVEGLGAQLVTLLLVVVPTVLERKRARQPSLEGPSRGKPA